MSRKNSDQDFLSQPTRPRRRRSMQPRRQTTPRASAAVKRRALALPRFSALWSVAALLAVGLIALLVYLFSDARFYVQSAALRGLSLTTAEQVYHQADIDQYNIFWINSRRVAERIQALPYVKQATVTTQLPNQVRIVVQERQPLALWKSQGQEYWVDSEGITMPVSSPIVGLPVLWDLDRSTVLPDGRVQPELITSLHQVKEKTPEVTDFGYDRTNGLQFRFPGGTYVYLGQPAGMVDRVNSLLILQQNLISQGQAPSEIHWRSPESYYIRLGQ